MIQPRRSSEKSVRVTLVTGASRGIGFEVSRQLATRGFVGLLTARELEVRLENCVHGARQRYLSDVAILLS